MNQGENQLNSSNVPDHGQVEHPTIFKELDNDISDLLRDNFGDLSDFHQTEAKPCLSLLDEIFEDCSVGAACAEEDVKDIEPIKEVTVEKVAENPPAVDPEAERLKYLRNARFSTIPAYQKRAKERAARKARRKEMRMEWAIEEGNIKEQINTGCQAHGQGSNHLQLSSNCVSLPDHEAQPSAKPPVLLSRTEEQAPAQGPVLSRTEEQAPAQGPVLSRTEEQALSQGPVLSPRESQHIKPLPQFPGGPTRYTKILPQPNLAPQQRPTHSVGGTSDKISSHHTVRTGHHGQKMILPKLSRAFSPSQAPTSGSQNQSTFASKGPVGNRSVLKSKISNFKGRMVVNPPISSKFFNRSNHELQTQVNPIPSQFVHNNNATKILTNDRCAMPNSNSNLKNIPGNSRNLLASTSQNLQRATTVITHSSLDKFKGGFLTPATLASNTSLDYNLNPVAAGPRALKVIKLGIRSKQQLLPQQESASATKSQCPGCRKIILQRSPDLILCQDCGCYVS